MLVVASARAEPDEQDRRPDIAENNTDDAGTNVSEELIVIGDQREGSLKPSSVLKGDELRREVGSTLGETLANELGVYNATFGPGVGLPVIRGMSGSRVRIMQGSIGSLDVSSLSPDHAVTIEPLLAEEIEITRGPGALRYGGDAMGGAVDIKLGRIPDARPKRGIDGAHEIRYDSNPTYYASVFKADAGKGPFVVHVDGFVRDGDGIGIPGNALDESAVLQQFGNLVEFENTNGFVANSDNTGSGLTLGGSLVSDRGYIGIAVNKMDNRYGIPPGGLPPHSDDPTVTEPTPENLRIDMNQTRWDVAAQLNNPLPHIESLSFTSGYVDYRHFELARGLPSTLFESIGRESRVELRHKYSDVWSGTLGYQWSDLEVGALGVESYIPTSDISRRAAYAIQSFSVWGAKLELAARRESSLIEPQEETRTVSGAEVPLPEEIKRVGRSLSGAVEIPLGGRAGIRVGFTRSDRTPAIQEMLSIGPHFATRTFDIGKPELEIERSNNLDIGLTYRGELFDLDFDVYRNRIEDYIYQEHFPVFFYVIETRKPIDRCVSITNCIPFFTYFQRDALFTGYEAEVKFRPPRFYGIDTELGVFSDYVRGYFIKEGAGDVPRLPPRRAGLTAAARWQNFDAKARWTHAFDQDRAGIK